MLLANQPQNALLSILPHDLVVDFILLLIRLLAEQSLAENELGLQVALEFVFLPLPFFSINNVAVILPPDFLLVVEVLSQVHPMDAELLAHVSHHFPVHLVIYFYKALLVLFPKLGLLQLGARKLLRIE